MTSTIKVTLPTSFYERLTITTRTSNSKKIKLLKKWKTFKFLRQPLVNMAWEKSGKCFAAFWGFIGKIRDRVKIDSEGKPQQGPDKS